MEGFWQSPFAFFSNDGKNPVCWTCAEKMSPDCVDLLRSFYYPTNAFSNRLVEKKFAEENRLNRLEFEAACSD